MDNVKNFLLTYDYEDAGTVYNDYAWFKNECEMRDEVEILKQVLKEFRVNEMLEIISARKIE